MLVEAIAPATLAPPKSGTAMASHDAIKTCVATIMQEPKSTEVNAGFRSSRSGQQKPPSKGNKDELSSLNKILDQIC